MAVFVDRVAQKVFDESLSGFVGRAFATEEVPGGDFGYLAFELVDLRKDRRWLDGARSPLMDSFSVIAEPELWNSARVEGWILLRVDVG